MLNDFEKRLEKINAGAGSISLDRLAVYAGAFDFGRDYKGVVAHFSAELEKAARMMQSHKENERVAGMVQAAEIAAALVTLFQGVGACGGCNG